MTWSYTPGNSNGDAVRLLCTDVDEDNPIFEDGEIAVFLSLEDSNIRRAAALALETISSQEVLLLKVLKISNLETSGDRLAKELRERAKGLREQADLAEARDGSSWEVAEMNVNDFAERALWWNMALRGQAP